MRDVNRSKESFDGKISTQWKEQLQVKTFAYFLLFLFFEGIEELFDIACGNRIAFYTVTGRPLFLRHIIGAEQAIVEGEMDREIHINGLFLYSMVPVMESWCDKKGLQELYIEFQIGMYICGIEINKYDIGIECRIIKP